MSLNKEWFRNEFITHEVAEFHIPLEEELSFYEDVSSGNVELTIENNKKENFIDPPGRGILSTDPIQNLRYHFIISAAMITRYCIHAGLEQTKAYSMSDFYIQKMDKCKTIAQIDKLHDTMRVEMSQKMNELHKREVISKPIVLCIDYIYSHLHYRITVSELAKYLNLSESYLSKLFKKEIGVPVSQYILDLKLEQAKNLLQYSDYSLTEIANYLAFSSQSHFIQAFSKSTGITPHKYRMRTFRTNWDKVSPDK